MHGKDHKSDAHERRTIAMLNLNRCQFQLSLMIAAATVQGQFHPVMWWDDKMEYFREMVDYAATAAELSSDQPMKTSPLFTLDLGINAHLYTVAVRCRDPFLRREAIEILRKAHRHEGLWRWDHVAHLADRIMALEEEGLTDIRSCHDVPEEARLKHIQIRFSPDASNATIDYMIRERIYHETLHWEVSALPRVLS